MKKIKIIREPNLQDFENEINKLLSKGWKIKGSILFYEKLLYQIMEIDKGSTIEP